MKRQGLLSTRSMLPVSLPPSLPPRPLGIQTVAENIPFFGIFMFRRLFRLLFLRCSSGQTIAQSVGSQTQVLSPTDPPLMRPSLRHSPRDAAAAAEPAEAASETSNCSLVTGQYNAPRGNWQAEEGQGVGDCTTDCCAHIKLQPCAARGTGHVAESHSLVSDTYDGSP